MHYAQTYPKIKRHLLPAFSRDDIMRGAARYYDTAERQTGLSVIGGRYGRVKPVLYSKGLSGRISAAFTFRYRRGQRQRQGAYAAVPATCLHELAPTRLCTWEQADFLAYFISTFADDVSVRYSGAMLALIRAMNALFTAQTPTCISSCGISIPQGLSATAKTIVFSGHGMAAVSETATQVNDAFLKANQQRDGVKSYGRMVDLLIGLWRNASAFCLREKS